MYIYIYIYILVCIYTLCMNAPLDMVLPTSGHVSMSPLQVEKSLAAPYGSAEQIATVVSGQPADEKPAQ